MENADPSLCRKITKTYVTAPTESGDISLKVDLFLPTGSNSPTPLLVWLHAGDFQTGTRDTNEHTLMAEAFAKHGYASAFIDYRLAAPPAILKPTIKHFAKPLISDAVMSGVGLKPGLIEKPALATVEDCASFFAWISARLDKYSLNGEFLLGGASAGGISALNTLFLAPLFGFDLPKIRTVLISSGGFAYPSYYRPCETRILALHNPTDEHIKNSSIRRLAHRASNHVTLIESKDLKQGQIGLLPDEDLAISVERLIAFDNNKPFAKGDVVPVTFPQPLKSQYSVCLVTTMKNEGPFVLEWIAYNLTIGVTNFLVFSNDCDDGTDEILDRLDTLGIIRHLPNPTAIMGSTQYHRTALAYAPYQKELRNADYVFISDVDEFLQVNVGEGTLCDLIQAHGEPDVISVSETLFGFGGVLDFKDKFVTEQFLKCHNFTPGKWRARRGVKSIVRVGSHVQDYSNHRPAIRPEALDKVKWTDGSGRNVSAEFAASSERGFDSRGTFADAVLNHYSVRSAESLLTKYERGDAVRPARLNVSYIRKRDQNVTNNKAMLSRQAKIRLAFDTIKEDAQLSALHDKAVTLHRAKIDRLKTEQHYSEIWDAIKERCIAPKE